ncbi:FYVE and coiled-coil domain-containing protein 1 isoform X2 [Gouania willdenowi]|uniref:FYVE and coiled-coil domain-containing protein 1 isoform X2 n=1 Tax=Gouania willdenowi TaxID=441366 RepID=UPI001055773F|nr:FYVE and coiled-coil domain-containing protein 1-like isoform X2 [Gouania willdenowi]
MAAGGATVGENQLQRIIRDLQEAVSELAREYKETGEPITDDSTNLQKFSYKLEYLLQFDQKEKTTFLGTKKDYWEYFSDCLAKLKGANDGIRFVKSITELKTSLGKGRAFIRYSLVHQRLADTLQQCLMNQRVTSDWYYARSPFLMHHLSADIINHLYELNEIQFDVASRGHDLDAAWPTFARRTLGNSPSHMWKPPSRSSSINSLASTYSQQHPELLSSPDYSQSLLSDLNDSLPACIEDVSTVEDLRLELDQSELKQRELLCNVQQLGEEAAELRAVVVELQSQLDRSLTAQEAQYGLQGELRSLQGREAALSREVEALRNGEKEAEAQQLVLKENLAAAEGKNIELMAKLDVVLNEKGQQAASYHDSAQKIHELLDRLKDAEKEKLDALTEGEERRWHTERLEEEVRVMKGATEDAEKELGALVKSLSEEKSKLLAKVEEQSVSFEKLQGALTLREKEANNLQKQLQDLQSSLEEKQQELLKMKMVADEEKDKVQKKAGGLKKTMEEKVKALTDELKRKDAELTSSCQTLQQLETKNKCLTMEKDSLNTSLAELQGNIKDQAAKIEEYKAQCASLMEVKEKLLAKVKKNEELKKDMSKNQTELENELASLRATEKHLRSHLDDSKVTLDEKEKRLREENRNLDESLQRATMEAKLLETSAKRLEEENQNLREEQDTVRAALSSTQADLKNVKGQIIELEKKLGVSHQNEASLQEQLKAKEIKLESKDKDLSRLQSRIEELETNMNELEKAKVCVEATCAKQTEMIERVISEKHAIETSQTERTAVQAKENQEMSGKLSVIQSQMEVNMKEVSRLQAEVLDLRVQLQRSEEETVKAKALLEMTEAQRNELRTLIEQLKSQNEALNQQHVSELTDNKKREHLLLAQHDREVAALAELTGSAAALREELLDLKAENERLALENNEKCEGLHRANTEMAELGMTICKLNAEKEEASEHWADKAAKTEQMEKEVEKLGENLNKLCLENNSLREELVQMEVLQQTVMELKEQLEKTRNQGQIIKNSSGEEMKALKFQMSLENMNHQVQIKSLNDQLERVKENLNEELEKVSSLQAKVSELEALNEQYLHLTVEKDALITNTGASLRDNEDEIQHLRNLVARKEEAHLVSLNLCEELRQKLNTTDAEKQSQLLKMTAEIDDLTKTKAYLEERIIELIKDKDALWQKSDALEFEQKLRAEERWWLMDKEATHCLGCQSQFTWLLRRHHCRICGRIFCYYCSNFQVTTKQNEKKERCCKDCNTQHSAAVESVTGAGMSPSNVQIPAPPEAGPQPPPESAPVEPTPESSPRSDDAAFDIITEEEVNDVYDSDATSQTTGESVDGEPDQKLPGALDIGVGDVTPENEQVSVFQDSEINLLRSGEFTMAVPLSVDDITHFGDASRELFIKSGSYSIITVDVGDCGSTLSWIFSTETKSMSFSVVFQEKNDTPLEKSKVLIPLTRCNAHKEKVQGQLKVQLPGRYTLIFDNSFSRFISKKVFYHLTMEKPVIYDGSDCP